MPDLLSCLAARSVLVKLCSMCRPLQCRPMQFLSAKTTGMNLTRNEVVPNIASKSPRAHATPYA